MRSLVVSLGGSVLVPSVESNTIAAYAKVLRGIAEWTSLFVVVGGGGEARRYIGAARTLGLDSGTADEIGIRVTRLNAALLAACLGDAAWPDVPKDISAALAASRTGKIVVMVGVTPGQTTDAVAAVLAERSGASLLVNLTSVDGIYSTDPRKDPRAERFSRITHDRLVSLIAGARLDAGANTVIDLVAAKVLERSGIPLLVLDGRDPDTLYRAVCTGSYDGTLVSRGDSPPLPL